MRLEIMTKFITPGDKAGLTEFDLITTTTRFCQVGSKWVVVHGLVHGRVGVGSKAHVHPSRVGNRQEVGGER